MGSLAGFPQLGECSSISITLLLVSQEIPGRVHDDESLQTHAQTAPETISMYWSSLTAIMVLELCKVHTLLDGVVTH